MTHEEDKALAEQAEYYKQRTTLGHLQQGFSQAPAIPHADAMTQLKVRLDALEWSADARAHEVRQLQDWAATVRHHGEQIDGLLSDVERNRKLMARIEALEKALPHPINSVCTGLYERLEAVESKLTAGTPMSEDCVREMRQRLEALEVNVRLINDKRQEGYQKLSELWRGPVDRPITVELLTAGLLRDQQIFLHGSNFTTPVTPMGAIEAEERERERQVRWHATRDAYIAGRGPDDADADVELWAKGVADRAHGPLEAKAPTKAPGFVHVHPDDWDKHKEQVDALAKAARDGKASIDKLAARMSIEDNRMHWVLKAASGLEEALKPFEQP